MDFLARRITSAKWKPPTWAKATSNSAGPIRADAITFGCLKTYDDNLSVWECDNNTSSIEEVSVALALNPFAKAIETVDILLFEKEELSSLSIEWEHNSHPDEAQTLVSDMLERHVNILHLDLEKLCCLAKIIQSKVHQGDVIRVTQRTLVARIKTTIDDGKVDLERLPAKIKPTLGIP